MSGRLQRNAAVFSMPTAVDAMDLTSSCGSPQTDAASIRNTVLPVPDLPNRWTPKPRYFAFASRGDASDAATANRAALDAAMVCAATACHLSGSPCGRRTACSMVFVVELRGRQTMDEENGTNSDSNHPRRDDAGETG